ncbi:MAG: hypothetical protein RRB13_01120 [bacterium]|nr:hypothetical protein [bacterium]
MQYISVDDARKRFGQLGKEEVAVTNRGKIAFYILPPEDMADLRLFRRKQRIAESKQIGEGMKAGTIAKAPFDELP